MAPIAILIAVLLILGPLNGLRRGAIKEGMALIGILLGALLAQGWATTWAQRLGGVALAGKGHSLAERLITLGLLIGIALLCGYGSGVLLPRRSDKMAMRQRLVGALLGFINIGLLCGFALVFVQRLWFDPFTVPLTGTTQSSTPPGTVIPDVGSSWILRTPLTRFFVDRLGLLLLGVAVVFALASLFVGLARLMSSLRRPSVTSQKQPATSLPLGASGTPPPRPGTAPAPVPAAASKPAPTPVVVASGGLGAPTGFPTALPAGSPQSTSMPSGPLFRDDAGTPGT